MSTNTPSRLSDSDLVAEVTRLAHCERRATVCLISHLAEFDVRRLYLGAGFSSLFTYCTEILRLSEHETYNRIEAARAARRFPILLELLNDGRLSLTTVRLIAPHLTGENRQELIAAASGKSKREVEEMLARRSPRPAIPSSVRKLPAAPAPVVSPPPSRRPTLDPLGPDRYAIKFTASAATREKLRLAQDLLRHVIPNGDPAEIFDRALTALLNDLARKKLAAVRRPAKKNRRHSASSRYVPATVKRAVWLRDGGQCAFRSQSGRRCSERGFLEFHHVQPYPAGGQATIENIELRCRAHNAYEAELHYAQSGPSNGEGLVGESFLASGTSHSFRNEFVYARAGVPISAWARTGE